MIPDYQTPMRPVLKCAVPGEVRIGDFVEELLPSGKQTRFSSRVHWAKSYLKQAGLVKATKRAHFVITDRGEL